jgi:hypothetical protein
MSDPGEYLSVDVGEDRVERLGRLGWGRRKPLAELAWAKTREDGKRVAPGQVPRDPVDETATLVAEGLDVDVTGQDYRPVTDAVAALRRPGARRTARCTGPSARRPPRSRPETAARLRVPDTSPPRSR